MASPFTSPNQPPLTVAEFVARHADDRVELVRGVVVDLPPAYADQGRTCCLIGYGIFSWVVTHDLGTAASNNSWVKTHASPDSIRGPDICFFSYSRIPRGPIPRGILDVVPELVVEVLSREEPRAPMRAKVAEYLDAGIKAVIVVHPENESIVVHRTGQKPRSFGRADMLTVPDVLPGFTFPVARLFS